MAATGSDVAVFVSGVVLAGMAPVYLFPGLDLGAMVAIAGQSVSWVPLEHVGVVALLALLVAAWIDTDRATDVTADVERWD
ncbi:hypothetical protein ACFR9U_16595 [Halorientalis brevis]|uniref:Uncharacterized protein n=1 Tax=Halorientalis brevis TaxID=1126241 RepID=A0ABD6CFE7_9EURY|nr:hypothetical protein [Halorientalis brevis]